jgi:hypothetical protein
MHCYPSMQPMVVVMQVTVLVLFRNREKMFKIQKNSKYVSCRFLLFYPSTKRLQFIFLLPSIHSFYRKCFSTMHGDDAPEIQHLAIRLLSQIASSSAAERNWSTYSFIHSIKRNRLSSKRAEKLVAVHSALRLAHRKTPEYRKGPATRWDVDPEDSAQIDEEDGPDMRVTLTQRQIVTFPLMVLMTSCRRWM